MKDATIAIHESQEPDPHTGAVITPIYQTSTFSQDIAGELKAGYDYTRAGNPTRTALENVLAKMEGGTHGFAFASGMGAITTLTMALLNAGDHVILGDDVYGGTFRLFDKILKRFEVRADFIDMSNPDNIVNAIKPNTKMIMLESPSNPMLKLTDLGTVIKIAKEHNLISVVDNTFATPILQKPFSFGADIILHSTTKYINGHSDVVGGALVSRDDTYADTLRMNQMSIGATPDPIPAWLTLRGLKTLALRMERHCASAQKLAEFLDSHDQIEEVIYPGLPSHPDHALAKTQMQGFGGMISARFKGDKNRVQQILSKLHYFILAESLGGVESLIQIPAIMTHASLNQEDRDKLGITENLVRISVGIEDYEDLQADFEQALKG